MHKVGLVVGFLFFTWTLGSVNEARAQFDKLAPEPLPPLEGTLFLHGGGVVSNEVRQLFVALSGGKNARIVVIPTADTKFDSSFATMHYVQDEPQSADASHPKLDVWKEAEPSRVDFLHADTPEEAAALDCDALLDNATAVWISGGKQTRLVDRFSGAKVEAGIHRLLARGGVVGGTSAGTAIASKIMLIDDKETLGFNLLPGAIVDQHFVTRKRSSRLRKAVDNHPDQVGLGIDERTALVVRGRQLEVVGESNVTVMLAASGSRPSRTTILNPGDRADLVALRRSAQARQSPPFPTEQTVAPKLATGSLVIAGGGSLPAEAMASFIQLAGGENARIVYIPCEEAKTIPREPGMVRELRRAGAGQVDWLHTKDRRLANDPGFVAKLTDATGIWFGGGRQWNLVDSYQNTEAHRLMHLVLERGGVIGGSSAGASIQGDYMPRGDPLGNTQMMAEGYERGLGFLQGIAIDQHFTQRNRYADMVLLKKAFPQLLGVGIDEGTCLIVTGSEAKVIGPGKVAFYDQAIGSEALEQYTHVSSGELYDLVARKRLPGKEER